MAHVLAIDLQKRTITTANLFMKAGHQPEGCATLWIDWDKNWWEARTRKQDVFNMFGSSQGQILTTHGFWAYGDADQVLATPSGNPLIVLRNYGLNTRDKLDGFAQFGLNPNPVNVGGGAVNQYLYYMFFWRKLTGQDMTRKERVDEMCAIAGTKYLGKIGGEVANQVKALAEPLNLGILGAILLCFATAAALGYAGFVAALRVLCGVADVATNWALYKPHWDRFAGQIDTGNDLDEGAQGLADLMGGLLGYGAGNVVAGMATKKVAPIAEKGAKKFLNACLNNSPERWKQAAKDSIKELQEKAAESGDPHATKMDPSGDILPSERDRIRGEHPDLIKTIRDIAIQFGFPPHIAEGYAMLAYRNGWTIIARTSKKASIQHHAMGPEKAVGKSLFVEWKIDSELGVIVEKKGMDIDRAFYSEGSYAYKQMKAILGSESPHDPHAAHLTDQILAEYKANNKFEFREVQIGQKKVRVLFHNDRMVIGDIDLMGIYVKRGHDLIPLPQWMLHNDAIFLQRFINRNVGGVESSFHGQQDVGRNAQGNPFRNPDATENYAVFTPDLRLSEAPNTAILEAMYRRSHILWPYRTFASLDTIFASYSGRIRFALKAIGAGTATVGVRKPAPADQRSKPLPGPSYPVSGQRRTQPERPKAIPWKPGMPRQPD